MGGYNVTTAPAALPGGTAAVVSALRRGDGLRSFGVSQIVAYAIRNGLWRCAGGMRGGSIHRSGAVPGV